MRYTLGLMQSWEDIKRWRKAERARLLEQRRALPLAERERLGTAIAEKLAALPELSGAPCRVGFYWPIRGEPDMRPFVRSLLEKGFEAALPVVVERNAPIEFYRWTAETKLTRQEVWGIPIPAVRDVVVPDVLLVPLVGFDDAAYRLGYGGGYYDRTLATFVRKPRAIGLGYELARLETIYPQPHDIPMDIIVTESRLMRREEGTS
ncbi:MAG: 5-formyltetrahydrofolate cyclo-ligase [Gammaproteobacteria bacterium]|nr:5-formyltetrahydrofolate cyclo-ligase [Gammaproteobacteria bacterium]